MRPRLLVFLAIFIPALGLLWWFAGGRIEPESRQKPPPKPKPTDAGATTRTPGQPEMSAGNFQFPRYENDRLVMEATGKGVKIIAEERVEVQDPTVVYYYYDPKRPDDPPLVAKILADRGVIDKRQDFAELSGHARIVVSDGSLIETEHILSHFKARDVSTEERVRLVRGGMTLAGTGLKADVRLEHLEFLREAEAILTGRPQTLVDLTRAAPAPEIAAGVSPESIEIRSAGSMVLDRRAPSEADPVARLHLTFRDSVILRRSAGGRVEGSGASGTISADHLALDLLERPATTGTGQPQVALAFEKARAEGHVKADAPEGRASGDALDVTYAADGTRHVTLTGAPPTMTLADSGGFKLVGDTRADKPSVPPVATNPSDPSPAEPVTITCTNPVQIDFPPPPVAGAPPRPGTAKFSGAVSVKSATNDLSAEDVVITFLPPVPHTSGGSLEPAQARLQDLVATGDVRGKSGPSEIAGDELAWRFDETLTVKGAPAVLTQPDGRISAWLLERLPDGRMRLTGKGRAPATVEQRDSRISAGSLIVEPDRGLLTAREGVEATFTPREGDEGGPRLGMGAQDGATDERPEPMTLKAESLDATFTGEPREIVDLTAEKSVEIQVRRQTATGDRFTWTRATHLTLLTGAPAAIAEGETRVEAQWILADPDADRVTLRGRKRLTIVRSAPPPPDHPEQAPGTERFVADCRGALIVLRGLGRIEFEEEVRLRSDTTTLECDHLVALLGADGQTVERLLAEGSVRITDPHGMATGDQVRWRVEDQSLLVRGLPTASAWKGADVLAAEEIRIDRDWQRVVATNRYRRVEARIRERVAAREPRAPE
ncbi:MAG: LPS export ABC transporter periplasmic protein LptC [Planctomycetes bacterium]|nr:LPS export ABC transporter periplasmic protein LptC [Planctomycetota bacterium]